jgi:acyl carrier protein
MNTVVDKRSGVAAKVKTIFHEKLGADESALSDNASFSNDLGLDSLDVLETFMELEKQFGIKISDEEAEKLTTVGSVIDYIATHARKV